MIFRRRRRLIDEWNEECAILGMALIEKDARIAELEAELVEAVGSGWTPSVPIDVEEMLRER